MKIVKQDTNGIKPLLEVGEFGYDNYPAGNDAGRVYVGTGTSNIKLGTQEEITALGILVGTYTEFESTFDLNK